MKKKVKNIFIIIGVVLATYFYYEDYLPPRTPTKTLSFQSNLDIPKSIEILKYQEQYAFTGEGYVYVLAKLNDKDFNLLTQEAVKKKYKKLTTTNVISDGFMKVTPEYILTFYKKNKNLTRKGYYQVEIDNLEKMSFSITILDIDKKELIVYLSFP